MAVIIFLITLIFFCSTFFLGLPQQKSSNPLFIYYFLQQNFIISNYFYFILGFIILVLIFFRFNFDKKIRYRKILLSSVIQTIIVVFIGFFVSYFLLIFIAFLQLNIFSMMINNDPKTLGIVDDKEVIVDILKTNRNSPEIIVSEKEQIVYAVAKSTSGTKNFLWKICAFLRAKFFSDIC